jgi:hypothetical protein
MKNYFEIKYEISKYHPMDQKTREVLKRQATSILLSKIMEEIEKNINVKYSTEESGDRIYFITEAFIPEGIL